jgi:hypothetical protein
LQLAKELVDGRAQIERVKAKRIGLLHLRFGRQICAPRANLDIPEFFGVEQTLQRAENLIEILSIFH